jgi:hypothetical protein
VMPNCGCLKERVIGFGTTHGRLPFCSGGLTDASVNQPDLARSAAMSRVSAFK